MVALLVRLKLTLLRRSFSRSAAGAIGMVVAYLFALGATVPAGIALGFLRLADPNTVGTITVPLFAVVTVAWLVLPLLFFGVDETLDPARFALLPVRAGELVPALVVVSLIGAPGLALLLLALGLVLAWSGSPATLVAALLAVPLGAVTCVLFSRALTTAMAGALGRRRAKENVAALVAFVGMFLGLGTQVAMRVIGRWVAASSDPTAQVRQYADIAGWTPFGWAWAVPADVAAGRYAVAVARLLLALALVAALAGWWRWALGRALVMPLVGQGDAERVHSSTGLERFFGENPRGAIAARIVRSWRRDSRALVQLGSLLVIPVLMVAPSLLGMNSDRAEDQQSGLVALLGAGPMVAVMAGLVVSNSLVLDGTAVALHALTGVSGRDDRWGRALAYLLLLVPVTALVFVGGLAVNGRWDLTLPLFGLTTSMLLCTVGGASWGSARWQWPAPQPGGNPFAKNSGGGAASLLLMLSNLAFAALGSAAVIALAVLAFTGAGWAGPAAAVVGPACGLAVLWFGCRYGGATLDRRWPEALETMRRS